MSNPPVVSHQNWSASLVLLMKGTITWRYSKLPFTVLPPCKASNTTYLLHLFASEKEPANNNNLRFFSELITTQLRDFHMVSPQVVFLTNNNWIYRAPKDTTHFNIITLGNVCSMLLSKQMTSLNF